MAITHFLAVDPKIHRAVAALERDENLLIFPISRDGEIAAITANGIRFFLNRISSLSLDEGGIIAERIGDVGI